ncbi:transcriptional activator FtrA [Nocardia otitidiscaviarum]|uniref:Transcriptional activator FtrA n=1 Tax=Nocardia otitidiscaviarum TaxID=1823 RepID=A0A379JJZ8_9NOCA|nr:phosphotransferase [Nocardia otitidiscaviarum]SUD48591.1 transcriptional activator FtrA [Nocardia otitidiscaviarum]
MLVIAYDDAQILDIACPCGAWDLANRFGADPGYAIELVSVGGRAVRTSAGIPMGSGRLETVGGAIDTLMVVGGPGADAAAADGRLLDQVRRVARRSRRIAAVCTGASLLAAAGLLERRRVDRLPRRPARTALTTPGKPRSSAPDSLVLNGFRSVRQGKVTGSGSGELATKMLEAAKRLAEAIAEKAGPRVSQEHREFPRAIRYGLDRTTRTEEQFAADLRGTDTPTPPDDRARSGLSAAEAHQVYDQVRDLEPDAAGTGNRINIVDTTAGPAVVRRGVDHPRVTMLKKWMPENTAIAFARASGVRTPGILYSGTDPATGRTFTIMQYVPGETRGFNDPEMMNWLPDLLDQVQLMSAHRLPPGMNLDVPQWQRQMIQHADDAYRNLPPERHARLDQLGIGPLSDYVQPDLSRSGEPTVFAHNDLYPFNLRLDDQRNLWILDWETAGPGDPLYNANFFLHRMGADIDDATHAQATAMWLDRLPPATASVDSGPVLAMYRTMEDWRGITMASETAPRAISEDPSRLESWTDWYETRFVRNPEPWPDIPKDELRTILRGWAEEAGAGR